MTEELHMNGKTKETIWQQNIKACGTTGTVGRARQEEDRNVQNVAPLRLMAKYTTLHYRKPQP